MFLSMVSYYFSFFLSFSVPWCTLGSWSSKKGPCLHRWREESMDSTRKCKTHNNITFCVKSYASRPRFSTFSSGTAKHVICFVSLAGSCKNKSYILRLLSLTLLLLLSSALFNCCSPLQIKQKWIVEAVATIRADVICPRSRNGSSKLWFPCRRS